MKHLAILILVAGSLVAYSQTQQREQVCLSEILMRTHESDTPAQVTEASHKAEGLRKAAQTGSSFAELAKQTPTAHQQRKRFNWLLQAWCIIQATRRSSF
jgi:hypothetical protein